VGPGLVTITTAVTTPAIAITATAASTPARDLRRPFAGTVPPAGSGLPAPVRSGVQPTACPGAAGASS